jgi:hypothetical protein
MSKKFVIGSQIPINYPLVLLNKPPLEGDPPPARCVRSLGTGVALPRTPVTNSSECGTGLNLCEALHSPAATAKWRRPKTSQGVAIPCLATAEIA